MATKAIIRDTIAAGQVSASDMASIFNAMIGKSGILEYRDNLKLYVVNNNTVMLSDGVYSLQGYLMKVTEGTTTELNIESGTIGMKRLDALVATYHKNGEGQGTDLLQFEIIRGEPTSGTPIVSEIITGDINATAMKSQEILYTVLIEGTEIKEVKQVADMIHSLENAVLGFFGGTIVEK